VSTAGDRGPVVVGTNVFGSGLAPKSRIPADYAQLLAGRPAFVSFQTVAELRYGAIRRGWGTVRMLRLDAKVRQAVIVHSGDELIAIAAQLRADCEAAGHALCQKQHSADLWIAATAIRLGVPLVSDDGIFRGVPGLVVESVAPA